MISTLGSSIITAASFNTRNSSGCNGAPNTDTLESTPLGSASITVSNSTAAKAALISAAASGKKEDVEKALAKFKIGDKRVTKDELAGLVGQDTINKININLGEAKALKGEDARKAGDAELGTMVTAAMAEPAAKPAVDPSS